MFPSFPKVKAALLASAVTVMLATVADAATITVSILDATDYNAGFGGGANTVEDFESLGVSKGAPGEVGASLATAVGTFTALGGTGSGGTVKELPGNSGKQLALRTGNVYGRENSTPLNGNWFLDSNDTWGMDWNVGLAGGTAFDQVMFTLTDGSDVGAFLRITANGESRELRSGGKLENGNARLVTIDFGAAVTSANIILGNYTTSGGSTYRLNDGFSIDGIQVAAVPLPASVLLLGAAIGGLGLMRRRKTVAA